MRSKEFIGQLDHARIVQAIRAEEAKTSGQIRVYLQRGDLQADPVVAAQKRFKALEMHKTRDGNAVLIFIAPRARKFAVVGDEGIHAKCGDALWERVVSKMTHHFKSEHFTDAIVEAIQDLGSVLADQFPPKAERKNELPDDVIEG